MTIVQFGNALKAQIISEERRDALGVDRKIYPNFFDNTHDYAEGQSAVIDELWNGGSLTQANLRNKMETGVYEDWRVGGPIDDTRAGILIGQVYDCDWNNADFLIEKNNNDLRVIDKRTGSIVGGTINIIALGSESFRWFENSIRGEEASIWKKTLTGDTTTESNFQKRFFKMEEQTSANSNLTSTNIKEFLDNEWDIEDVINDNTDQLRVNNPLEKEERLEAVIGENGHNKYKINIK